MMREKNISTLFVTFTISSFLILLVTASVPAVEKWCESHYEGGWQIWIEAKDFDEREGDNLKTSTEAGLFNF